MGNLKYNADTLRKFYGVLSSCSESLCSGILKDVVIAFEQNVSRGQMLFHLPEFLLRISTNTAAQYIKEKNPGSTIEGLDYLESSHCSLASLDALLGDSAKPEALKALDHMLGSILLNSWTAFEVLMVDMWIAAVNARPLSLGENALRSPKIDKNKERPIHPTEPNPKVDFSSIRIDLLREHGFDLSDKLGTIIYESRKFDFNRLDNIQYAYRVCFGDEVFNVFSLHPKVRALEAIRNLIVHRSGQVDKPFVERMKDNLDWKHLKRGDTFPVDAEIAVDYTVATLQCGTSLANAVDKWLIDNPN